MASTPVAIGPFTGGLNNYSDPSAVGDNECTQISNFDIDIDGTLVSRPPIFVDGNLVSAPGGASDVLGMFVDNASNTVYIVFNTTTQTRAYNVSTKTHEAIVTNISSAAVMYDNKLWLVSAGSHSGGWWSPTSTFTEVPTMPKGISTVVYKERMFIANANGRMYFSNAGNLEEWGASDFLDIRAGDGQTLVKLMEFSGQIVAFKSESTYIFQYDSAPTRGVVQAVSTSVGADDKRAVVEQDGIIYVLHNQTVYSINNWRWEQINIKVVFNDVWGSYPQGAIRNYSLSVLGYRLVVRFGTKYYIYGLKTRVWTEWASETTPDFWIKHPEKNNDGLDVYYAGTYFGQHMYKFVEKYDTESEDFTCSVTSKVYDYSVPYSYKRLFWWGVDVVASSDIRAKVTPYVYVSSLTWNEIKALGLTWDMAKQQGRTWGRPAEKSLDVTDSASITERSGARVMIRYIKSLRFRKVSFYIESDVDGTSNTGPLRVFSLVSNISNRQLVPRKIN